MVHLESYRDESLSVMTESRYNMSLIELSYCQLWMSHGTPWVLQNRVIVSYEWIMVHAYADSHVHESGMSPIELSNCHVLIHEGIIAGSAQTPFERKESRHVWVWKYRWIWVMSRMHESWYRPAQMPIDMTESRYLRISDMSRMDLSHVTDEGVMA